MSDKRKGSNAVTKPKAVKKIKGATSTPPLLKPPKTAKYSSGRGR